MFFGVIFYNPKTDYVQADWSNYLVIALVLGLVCLGVAGSILTKVSDSQTLPVRAIKCFSIYDNLKKIVEVPRVT